jgi:ATP-dependent DNA helicase RecG
VPDETATVIVEVRSISSRPVRRRGMKPLVEAVVADATGVMRPPSSTALAQGPVQGRDPAHAGRQVPGANRFRVNSHARTDASPALTEAASQYPPPRASPRRRSSPPCASTASRGRRRRAAAAALRVAEALPDRPAAVAAAHFGDREGGRARLAFDELLVDQVVQLRLRAERRATQAGTALTEEPTLSRVWRDTLLPFTPTGDQADAMDEIDADLAAERPMQRLLMGEVGSGKTVVAPARHAARGRARHAGGHDGPHRDAGRAALRHAAGAHARLAGPRRAADRLDAGRAGAPTCWASCAPAS